MCDSLWSMLLGEESKVTEKLADQSVASFSLPNHRLGEGQKRPAVNITEVQHEKKTGLCCGRAVSISALDGQKYNSLDR